MKNKLVVLLGYKSRSGKDTVFNLSGEDLGFKRVAFADKLKETVADLYGFSDEQMYGDLKDVEDARYINTRDERYIYNKYFEMGRKLNPDYREYFTPRRILQLFAYDQRSINQDIWADYAFNATIQNSIYSGHNKFIITDFRFRNEAEVARRWEKLHSSHRVELVHIDRPGVESKTGAGDISENDLNDFNGWTRKVLNNSSLEDLKTNSTRNLVESIISAGITI